jgi:hypothetical protein
MNMFSATESAGTMLNSWWMKRKPSRWASAGPAMLTGRSSIEMVAASGATTPARILISVDLPAPFSPISA